MSKCGSGMVEERIRGLSTARWSKGSRRFPITCVIAGLVSEPGEAAAETPRRRPIGYLILFPKVDNQESEVSSGAGLRV